MVHLDQVIIIEQFYATVGDPYRCCKGETQTENITGSIIIQKEKEQGQENGFTLLSRHTIQTTWTGHHHSLKPARFSRSDICKFTIDNSRRQNKIEDIPSELSTRSTQETNS